ncbi:DUF1642 domain-containing protein [Enterococcus sp.]|uniref:DUF1642 domain-containing protein n=1 Tax=Enterococcus sp. TaxID=35783 RepID=UPI002FCC1A95
MNKKELIERIQNLESESEYVYYQNGFEKAKYWCLTLASNLEESQTKKVEVPDFVAEWFEENKGDINQAMYNITIDIYGNQHTTEFEKWFSDSRNDTYGTIVRMKDGYTIKSKQLMVKKSENIYVHDISNGLYSTITIEFCDSKSTAYKFADQAKAEAVATLVDGSVEEV